MTSTKQAGPDLVGIALTLETLATTKNDAAVEVLLEALDASSPDIQLGALETLLKRRSHHAQVEILRRLNAHSEAWRPVIEQRRGALAYALRDGLLGVDDALSANACAAIVWFREYDLAPALITALEDETNRNAQRAADTLLSLADLLYEELAGASAPGAARDPQVVRRNFIGVLEGSVQRFFRHKRVEPLRALLSLAGRENSTLKRILQDPHHAAFVAAMDVLLHESRGGVVRLLLSFLDDPHAPSAAISALARRSDHKFLSHLMRKIGFAPSALATQNLKRIDTIGWLKTDIDRVDALDDAGQHSLVQLLTHTSVKRAEMFQAVEYLLRAGKCGGRRAAAVALARFNGADANAAAQRAMNDEDEQVQAAIVKQLRQRGISGALNRVIDLLDSPLPAVRDAARQSLAEFDFDRYAAAYDLLDEEIRHSTGVLVKKINPHAIDSLKNELAAKARTRRLRALGIAVAMEAVTEIRDSVIDLLADDDHLVRAEAARALGHCHHPAARAALREAISDRSVPVQEAVLQSLELLDAPTHGQPRF